MQYFEYYNISYLYQMGVSILWLKGLLMCYGPVVITMIIILVLYTQMDSNFAQNIENHEYIEIREAKENKVDWWFL